MGTTLFHLLLLHFISLSSYYEKFLATGEVKCIDEEIPFEIPDGWEWEKLGNIASICGGKRIPVGQSLTTINTGHKYIRVTDMKNHSVNSNDIHYITEDIYQKIKAYYISKEDLYITVAGTIGHIGEIPEEFDNANLTENANKIVFRQMDKKFLMYCLSSDVVQSQITAFITKVGQPKLAIMRIQNLLIPVPPLKEQFRIVNAINLTMPFVNRYESLSNDLSKLNISIFELLKKSILQEAIQGKLVPQVQTEGTAQELLEQIRQEKEQLVKEGKLKKSAITDSVIYKGDDNKYYEQVGNDNVNITEEIPFDLPDSWAWVRFGQYVRMSIGKTPPRGETKYWTNGKYPWVSISDMSDYGMVITTKESVSEYAKSLFGEISPVGTLIMSFKLTVGRTSLLNTSAYHNEAIISIYPFVDKNCQARNYLFHILPIISNLGDSKDAIKGKTLNSKSLNNLLLPLPPLDEQGRIVAMIELLFDKLK